MDSITEFTLCPSCSSSATVMSIDTQKREVQVSCTDCGNTEASDLTGERTKFYNSQATHNLGL